MIVSFPGETLFSTEACLRPLFSASAESIAVDIENNASPSFTKLILRNRLEVEVSALAKSRRQPRMHPKNLSNNEGFPELSTRIS